MSKKDISDYNGQRVKELLQDLVDDENTWEWENKDKKICKEHIYTIYGEYRIKIEPRPSPNQPGNGLVSFYDDITMSWVAPMWYNLEYTLKDPSFPSYHETFNSQPMDEVTQQYNVGEDKKFQTAFLLLFEIVRRAKEVPESPTRDETEDAIRIALTYSAADYLVDMFTKKKNVTGLDFPVTDFRGRRRAYEDLLTLKSDNDLLRQLDGLSVSGPPW